MYGRIFLSQIPYMREIKALPTGIDHRIRVKSFDIRKFDGRISHLKVYHGDTGDFGFSPA